MTKNNKHFRDAFTLIEVMVAVMIISVVIMTLIEMFANNTHIFMSLKKQTKTNQYSSFLVSNNNYGFEDKNIYLDDLLSDFNLEDDLRRELKDTKVKIIYQELQTIDTKDPDSEEDSNLSVVFEVGNSIIKGDELSSAMFRLRIQ